MLEKELIEGEEIVLGGETFVLPPYSMRFIRLEHDALQAKLQKAHTSGDMKKGMLLAVEIVHKALVRNYPDLTMDDLEEKLDKPAMDRVMAAIIRINGLKLLGEKAPGEDRPSGT